MSYSGSLTHGVQEYNGWNGFGYYLMWATLCVSVCVCAAEDILAKLQLLEREHVKFVLLLSPFWHESWCCYLTNKIVCTADRRGEIMPKERSTHTFIGEEEESKWKHPHVTCHGLTLSNFFDYIKVHWLRPRSENKLSLLLFWYGIGIRLFGQNYLNSS